ncbi:hypothetical protein GCK32_002515 [Trichostrongylus colubriformis]|uniref:Uncharacterized protein n=1 Tax=Trichostrongylus colubriformis TaxID=6319 RepID=A0AAN8I9K0_TRICO
MSILHTKTRRQRYFRDCDKFLEEVFEKIFSKNHKNEVFLSEIILDCIRLHCSSLQSDLSDLQSELTWQLSKRGCIQFLYAPHIVLVST